MPFASITAFTYHTARLAVANTEFGIELWQGKKRTSVTLTGGDDLRHVYTTASDVLFERLGHPALESAIARIDAGESAELGGWTFDRSGATQDKKSMPWSAPYRMILSTMSQFPCTYVNAEIDGKDRQIGVFGAESPHSCIVPIVFELGAPNVRRSLTGRAQLSSRASGAIISVSPESLMRPVRLNPSRR